MTKEKQLANIHARAKLQFDKIQSAVREERLQCLEDRRFYSIAGAQWEGKLGEQFANKPKFEVNKIHLAVIRIINEYRNNRITVDFVSKDGTKNDDLADTCDGLYRADEQDSGAEEAYDNAFEEAVGGGFGAFRLRACEEDEEDEENERQRIKIEPIFDADSCVFFDLDAKRQDKADANHCFVLTSMTHDAYKDEYGDDPSTWDKNITNSEFDWCTPDIVYVAEYYVVEKVKEKQHIFVLIDGTEQRHMADELEDDPSILERLNATGAQELRVKTLERRKVHKYMMSGSKVLEDCGYIAGRHIPIVPVYGKRWFIDNIERCMGHVRLCKDAQRLPTGKRPNFIVDGITISSDKNIVLFSGTGAGCEIKNYSFNDRVWSSLTTDASALTINDVQIGDGSESTGEQGFIVSANNDSYARVKTIKGRCFIDPSTQKLTFFSGSLNERLGAGIMVACKITLHPLNRNGNNSGEKHGEVIFSSAMDYNATDMSGHLNVVRTGTLTTLTTVSRNFSTDPILSFDLVVEVTSPGTRFFIDFEYTYNGIQNVNGKCWTVQNK
ncbi:portal protein [Acinetobacter nosocomialis]|uniref:portal protein n=1 Tax=Acinetobacter nosocomialis TaxID=106654 RepID=UPI0031FE2C72